MTYPCDKCEDGRKMCAECKQEARNTLGTSYKDECKRINACLTCKCEEQEEWDRNNSE